MIHTCIVRAVMSEAQEVYTLALSPVDYPAFIPGQFALTYLKDGGSYTNPGVPYSFSSAPDEPFLTLTIKATGSFSRRLASLCEGDQVFLGDPLGFFTPKPSMSHVVGLAGGVGIAPFRSMIRARQNYMPGTQLSLFASFSRQEDLLFEQEIRRYEHEDTYVKAMYSLTRDADKGGGYGYGRIDAELLKKHLAVLTDKEYFLCGSTDFVQGMQDILIAQSVPLERIHTETFY